MSLANVTFSDTGELPSDYDFERTLLIGSFLGCMTWGINFTVYGATMYFWLTRPGHQQCSSRALMACMTVIFAMSTTYVGTNIQANVDMYINHRDDPGGPLTYALLTFDTPLVLVGNNICPVISIFLNDALLVWRLYIIWGVIWIVVLPVIMLIASTVMGILLIYTSAQPEHTFNSMADAVHFGTAYFSISLSLTVIATLTIVLRLIYFQHRARKVLGNTPESQDHYISAWAILLESSAMYAVIGFIFLVLYNKNNAVSNIFIQLMVQVMCISSDLIILRVMIGKAWTARMSEEFSSLVFNPVFPASITEIEFSGHKQVGGSLSSGSQRTEVE